MEPQTLHYRSHLNFAGWSSSTEWLKSDAPFERPFAEIRHFRSLADVPSSYSGRQMLNDWIWEN